ncbi:fructose-specific PTS system IIABC component [Spiroplasma kunkelii CR2-3x]|uniref:Fructose-specific PTS system IIABC component n=1 Tax=Spiroplasma kunkelii CR2-3x TaxID=273035 RepID=A0A0K2JFE3_SPIKU|nr:fructose-specific PTS transporter subunit EIIC [Spiroplasma kunkelii]ALA97290.1 fructose-specific PTS system IIABC component [Spiroplasma kunkelii CR2-3x]
MKIIDYFTEATTFLKTSATDKAEVFSTLATALVNNETVTDSAKLIKSLEKRETEGPTGVGDGLAIPHCSSSSVIKPSIAIMTLEKAVDWQSLDNKPVDIIFMITTPEQGGEQHLQALAKLASFLGKSEVVTQIRAAKNFADILKAFIEPVTDHDKMKTDGHYDVIGITACPTGIAHTYMAKEKLEEAAKAIGLTIKVETQGRSGNENVLTATDIANSKAIILGIDKKITGMDRFKGVSYLETSTKNVIYNGPNVIQDALNDKHLTIGKGGKGGNDEVGELSLKNFKDVIKNLLGGVSRMLPFVVAGGIILGIGFLLDSGKTGKDFGVTRDVAAWFSGLGKVIFAMMIPILGAYVCYSIVGPQGLLPGMIAGLIANAPGMLYDAENKTGWANTWGRLFPDSILNFNSGFFGALIGGYLVAFAVYGCQKGFAQFHPSLRGVRDIVLIPVLTALAAGVLMFSLNIPLGYLNYGLSLGLKAISDYNLNALIGIIIGLMMAADMGGPINKAAYVFGTLTIDSTQTAYEGIRSTNGGTVFMACAMLAGMVPPLALALCTRMFKKYWTKKEVEQGNTNYFLAACFITEGAIPFAVADSKRTIPSIMAGSAITGAIVSGFGVTLAAPHGGVFVFPLLQIQDNGKNWFSISNHGASIGVAVLISVIALIIGSFISALILGFWRMHDVKNNKITLAI